MRTFKTKAFTRFADKAGIPDLALCRAVRDAERGLIAPDPGGGVIKQRIARPGQGKSGGFRTPIVSERAHGPSSSTASRRTKRTTSREKTWPPSRDSQPKCWLYEGKTMARVVAWGVLLEVTCDEKTIP